MSFAARAWTEEERDALRKIWHGNSLTHVCETLDRCEKSVVSEAYCLGLTNSHYAQMLMRNDSETIRLCRLLIKDGELKMQSIAQKLEMPVGDVYLVRRFAERDYFSSRRKSSLG